MVTVAPFALAMSSVSPTWSPWPCVSTIWVTPLIAAALSDDEGRIAGEERIDQHRLAAEIETEGGMAKPGDLHWITMSVLLAGANRSSKIVPMAADAIGLKLHALHTGPDMARRSLPLIEAIAPLAARGALIGLDLGTKTIGVAASDPRPAARDRASRPSRARLYRGCERLLALAGRANAARSASCSVCRSTWTAPKDRARNRRAPSRATWRS